MPAEVLISPQVYISWIPRGNEVLTPLIFATVIPPEQKPVKVNARTRRCIAVHEMIIGDSIRESSKTNHVSADTTRTLYSDFLSSATVGLSRRLTRTNLTSADTERAIIRKPVSVRFDTVRIFCTKAFASADVSRRLGNGAMISMPLVRKVVKVQFAHADTSIRIPHVLRYVSSPGACSITRDFNEYGIRSFSMTLGELTLSDTFRLETVRPMEIDDMVQGDILDYRFRFLVEETSQRDMVQTVKGMYSKDALLYTAISIFVDKANVSYYAQEISRALGMNLNMACDDFIPSQNFEDSGMTYQDFISSLFGWTSRLPQRQVNVFIRGDTLNIIQRGLERSVIDITDWPHSRPTIEKKLIRSIWNSKSNDGGDNQARSDKDDEPIPFTGTISLGEISRTYSNGFLVRETNEEGYIEYSYAGEYLSEKRTHNKDGSTSLTRYSYAETNRDIYLFKEQERTTDSIDDGKSHDIYDWTDWDNENGTERVTYHAPLGYGWYATTVYVDGSLEGSSLSQGKPGGKASRFTIDQSNLSLGSGYPEDEEDDNPHHAFTSLIDTEFPVEGEEYLRILTDEIEWLNRKIQETIAIEIHANVRNGVPDINHVVDFTERIMFHGNEYYLVSNTVELTPRSLKQSIKMTRWY